MRVDDVGRTHRLIEHSRYKPVLTSVIHVDKASQGKRDLSMISYGHVSFAIDQGSWTFGWWRDNRSNLQQKPSGLTFPARSTTEWLDKTKLRLTWQEGMELGKN